MDPYSITLVGGSEKPAIAAMAKSSDVCFEMKARSLLSKAVLAVKRQELAALLASQVVLVDHAYHSLPLLTAREEMQEVKESAEVTQESQVSY